MRPLLMLLAVLAAPAVVLLASAPTARLGPGIQPGQSVAGPAGSGGGSRVGRRGRWLLVAGVLVAGGVAALPGTTLGVALVGSGAGAVVWRLVLRSRVQAAAAQRRRSVVDYCEALLGELRAGQPVAVAVERAVDAWPDAHPAAAAARLGADVPTALRRLGDRPGAGGLVRLADTWELCSDTGAGLAAGVERLLESVRAEDALHRQVRGELASARATAWLVAVLPVVVLVAAQGMGGKPSHFLLDTPVGVGCLAGGVAFAAAGLLWLDRIAARAVQGG